MVSLPDQIRYSTSRGPEFVEYKLTHEKSHEPDPVRAIAFYLPQFHREPVNDEAWGEGFTEWTNVTKTFPRFPGHVQPRIPANLGFYDLGNPETIKRQAKLARDYGVYGFAIHDYWFDGKTVLRKPMDLILQDKSIELRFCLNWANEAWTRRWDGGTNEPILSSPGHPEEAFGYIQSIAPALKDERYIRFRGRPLLMIYRLASFTDPARTVANLREAARQEGIGDLHLISFRLKQDMDRRSEDLGLDGMVMFPPHGPVDHLSITNALRLYDSSYHGRVIPYARFADFMQQLQEKYRDSHPCIVPSWDNTPRRGETSLALCNLQPEIYAEWLYRSAVTTSASPDDERLVFINAWNEWAEGAILEPCQHFGFAFLDATRRGLVRASEDLKAGRVAATATPMAKMPLNLDSDLLRPHAAWKVINRLRRLPGRLAR